MTQAYNLSQLANNLNTAGQLDATDGLVNAVPVANGGTGASSAAGAATILAAAFGNLLYPVGSLYFNATNSTNPGTLLGFGTWAAFGAGRVPVGFDSGNVLFDTAEETGGSADATTVAHTHTATSTVTDPGHNHTYTRYSALQIQSGSATPCWTGTSTQNTGSVTTGITVATTVASTGSSGTNANYQPYITVYMWKRTA
jgi:hypothetical protein